MEDFKSQLSKHFGQFATNPYLFIGSGLSRRYYGLPTWISLIEEFYSSLKIKTDFNYYLSKSNNAPAVLASTLADEFHEIWWKDPSYGNSRKVFREEAKKEKSLPFKYELTKYISSVAHNDGLHQEEIDLLKNAVIDGIITTNWDDFLNSIFPDFKVFIGQQGLLFADSFSVGEIYKIHGCCSKPSSLIITQEDYANFNSKNAYLAAKLLTIFVEHPVVFLGYSLSDPNIMEIIDSIVQCVDSENINQLKDRLVFIEWRVGRMKEPVFQDNNFVLKDKNVLPIKHVIVNSFTPVFEVLNTLKKRLPIRVLQRIKESVYEIVKTNKPTKNIYVGELDKFGPDSNVQFVVGIGVADKVLSDQGYKAIEVKDILEDVIFDNKGFSASKLVENTFHGLTKGNSYVPLCKYLSQLDYFSDSGSLTQEASTTIKGKVAFRNDMPSCLLPPATYKNKKSMIRARYRSITSLVSEEGDEHALLFIQYMDRSHIDLDELQQFLARYFTENETKPFSTAFRKLVCLFDYCKYCKKA